MDIQRNISGIWIFQGEKMKRTLRCLEDCDIKTQVDYVSSLDKENLEKLVLSLSATLREIGDKHGIVR